MIRDILFIEGEPMDMAEDKAVTLTFKSPLLTDVSKQAANYSQTINLPRTPKNETLLGLPLHLSETGGKAGFRFEKRPARLDRNGITIAEGDVYLLDSSGDAISVAFIFGRIPLLERLKESEATINDLANIGAMTPATWSIAVSKNIVANQFIFPLYNSGVSTDKMEEAGVGYYGAVSVLYLLIGITGGRVSFSEKAEEIISDLWLMCAKANDSDYTANLSRTRLTPTTSTASSAGPNVEKIGQTEMKAYDVIPYFSGETQYNGQYGEIVEASVSGYSRLAYQATADQTLTIYPNALKLQFRSATEYDLITIPRLQFARLVALVYNPDTGETRRVYGSKVTQFGRDSSADTSSAKGYLLTFDEEFAFEIKEGEQVQLRVMLPLATDDSGVPQLRKFSGNGVLYKSSSLGEPIALGEIYHPAGNLPDIKPIDFLKGLSAMLGLYVTADANGLYVGTLNEVFDNLAGAQDWSERLVIGEKGGLISHHYFSVGDYKAQRNVIAFKEDNNDPDKDKISESARKVVLSCENAGLEHEKTLVTLPFAQTNKNAMRHYTFKPAESEDEPAEVDRKELAPRIVRLYYNIIGNVCADNAGLTGTELQSVNYRALQNLIRQPHRIKVAMKLTTIDLLALDMERPIYLAQFGQYFLVEEVQTTSSDICEVTLIKING